MNDVLDSAMPTGLDTDDVVGMNVRVFFRGCDRTVEGTLGVDEDGDLVVATVSSGDVLVLRAQALEVRVLDDDTEPSVVDLGGLLAAERGCSACGTDRFGVGLQQAVALIVSRSGSGFGLCNHHLRRHIEALYDQDATIVYHH